MLGTGSIMANEVLFNIQPLKPGEEKYAISFAIPMNTKGLKSCRASPTRNRCPAATTIGVVALR